MPKILIIRFSSIGDIVLTTPIIRCIKQQVPEAEVHFLTKQKFAGIVKPNPYIDKVHLLDDDLSKTLQSLRAEQFDYVVDLHHNLRTLRVKWGLKVRAFAFDKLNFKKWLLTALKIDSLPRIHIVDRYFATVKELGVEPDGKGLDFFIEPKDIVFPEKLPASHRPGYIALVVGGALATKQLPLEKLDELCGLIPYPLVLLGGPGDATLGSRLAENHSNCFNACGIFSLGQSADLVRNATLVITHDTGLMHIATAFGKPIISIWGNTVPEFGMFPFYAQNANVFSRVFEVKNLPCRPCSKIGYSKCPKGHFRCMMNQDIGEIAKTVNQVFKS